MSARGIRLNNPGDIRHSKITWQGQSRSQPDPAFVNFIGPEYGIRAIAKILLTYEQRKIDTIREDISTWAPPIENDTAAYMADVAHRTGFGQDQVLDLRQADQMVPMLRAIVHHETGSDPYPLCTYVKAVQLAGLAVKSFATAAAPAIAGAPLRPAGFNPGD